MAMNGDVMAAAVIAAINTLSDENKAVQLEVMKKMCGAITAHIAANAVVTVANVTAVTVGVGVSGPGTGTIA